MPSDSLKVLVSYSHDSRTMEEAFRAMHRCFRPAKNPTVTP
jgi:hypothetical protein